MEGWGVSPLRKKKTIESDTFKTMQIWTLAILLSIHSLLFIYLYLYADLDAGCCYLLHFFYEYISIYSKNLSIYLSLFILSLSPSQFFLCIYLTLDTITPVDLSSCVWTIRPIIARNAGIDKWKIEKYPKYLKEKE